MATDLTIANTIAEQIGNRAFFMMGTRSKVGGPNYLSFDVRGSKAVSHVRVTLNAMDTYDVEFLKIRGTNIKTVSKSEDIYAESLHEIISVHTGLALSL